MRSVNKAILIGHLGKDPESRFTGTGQRVVNFSIATTDIWNDKNTKERQERTEWHRIVAWGKLADICAEYLRKGKQVYVEGRIQTRSWEDKEGKPRTTTEITATNVMFLSSSGERVTTEKEEAIPDFLEGDLGDTMIKSEDDIPF